jgi:hypothetical protein
MAAVTKYHTVHRDHQIQPADLSRLARDEAIDRYERSDLDSQERQAHEALCDSKAAPERLEIEGARQRAIEDFAERFGISRAEAAVRIQPGQGERNHLDSLGVEVAHARQSRPAQPIPCPDCGSQSACEHDQPAEGEGPHNAI